MSIVCHYSIPTLLWRIRYHWAAKYGLNVGLKMCMYIIHDISRKLNQNIYGYILII